MKKLKDKTVMIVDDDEFNIYLLRNLLELEGAKVVSHQGAISALNYLNENNDVDIVLTDIMMPGMSGYELIEKMQTSTSFACIPVIAVSTKQEEDEEERCKNLGAVGYIRKPIELEVLIELVKFYVN